MAMTIDRDAGRHGTRRTGDGVVMVFDRSQAFRRAGRRTVIVRALRIALPLCALALVGAYALVIARTSGLVHEAAVPELAMRKILPEDLAMKNPRYEGFNKDGGSYVFTAKTAQQDFTVPNVITLNGIVGEVYQPDKTRTDITAIRGIYNNQKGVLDLYEQINVDSQSGLKARLTRATLVTKDDLLTSPEPVLVEFPNGSVRSQRMTLRQKAREATFVDKVVVVLTPPPDAAAKVPAEEVAGQTADAALFAPSNGPINIDSQRLDINDTGKMALFTGSVVARQAGSSLTTPELEVFYEGEGMMAGSAAKPVAAGMPASDAGKVKRIVAKKPVVMKRENGDVVTSDSAEFDAQAKTALLVGEVVMTSGADRRATSKQVDIDEAKGIVQLSGGVVITQGLNELRGGRFVLDRQHSTAELTSPPGEATGPGRIAARLVRGADARAGTKAREVADETGSDASPLGSFKANPNAPVDLSADALHVDDKRKVAIFRGDVDAKQDTFKITCAELSAFYKGEAGLTDVAAQTATPASGEKSSTELTRIEARKDVRVTSKDGQTATGDWADFDTRTNKVTMGGNVVLSRGKSMVRGTRLLIDLTTGESKIDTAPQNTVSNPGGGGWATQMPAEPAGEGKGRASAVFFPQELKGENKGAAKQKQVAPAIDGWSATSQPDPPN